MPAAIRPSIILSHWGRKDANHTSGTGYFLPARLAAGCADSVLLWLPLDWSESCTTTEPCLALPLPLPLPTQVWR